jgi:predicted dinucleotide-binding enzyme
MIDQAFRRYLSRRGFVALTACAVAALSTPGGLALAAQPAATPLKIGIIGTGRIGGALARHWAKAGHEVFISSRHPEQLKELAAELGPKARVGTPKEAAAFGQVVLVSVPYAAMPQIGADYAAELAGKIIIDTSNPREQRDGAMAVDALAKGSGIATADFLKNRRVVRAFNCIGAASLAADGNRKPERYAIPIGGDDAAALAVAQRLVNDAGFDAVVMGSLAKSREFDMGGPLAKGTWTAAELRAQIAR